MSGLDVFKASRSWRVWQKMGMRRQNVVAASSGQLGGALMRRLVVTALPDSSAPRRWIPAQRRSPSIVKSTAPRQRVVRCGLSVTGFGLSAVFYCLSFTPSLLPRPWLLQGVVAGLTAAMGYSVGTAIGAIVRLKCWPSRRVEMIAWRLLFALVPLLIVVFLWLGTRW